VIRTKWTDSGRRRIRKRMQNFKESAAELYHYKKQDDTQIVEFVMMPAIALTWRSENPLWSQIIGAPSSGKTAHISLYQDWHKVKMVSRLTKNSLISGFRSEDKPKEDPSFLKELDGKLLIIKDFTTILQSPKEERDSVIGQLRDIFDGNASRVFGTIGLQEYKVKFNLLLAVTNVIDSFHSVNQQLGERFISRREYGQGRKLITATSFDNIMFGRNNNKIEELRNEFQNMLDRLPSIPINAVEWDHEMRDRAIMGADFISRCRSHVVRERDGKSIAGRPSPEVGARLVTQIVQCVASQSIATGYDTIREQAWRFGGSKVLRDTLPSAITWILYHMWQIRKTSRVKGGPWFTVKDLLQTKMGWSTIDQITVNMYHNGLLEGRFVGRTGRRSTKFRLKDSAYEVINETRLFTGYSNDESEIKRIREGLKSKERKRKTKKDKLLD